MSTGLVRLRAVACWRNNEHEGFVEPGQVFLATEQRARDLELSALAVRVIAPSPRVIVHEDPAWGIAAGPAIQPTKASRARR